MKKLLLLLVVASVGLAGTANAQKKSKRDCGNDKNKYSKKYDRRDRNDRDDRYDWNNDNNRYGSNAPRKVRDAFNRDFPKASNVSWSHNRGIWTASYKKGFMGGGTTVSYRANGERLRNNDYNNRTARNNTRQKPSVWNGAGF